MSPDSPFPDDGSYDFGDACHLPIVPVFVENPPAASQEETETNSLSEGYCPPQEPVPGDAGNPEGNPPS